MWGDVWGRGWFGLGCGAGLFGSGKSVGFLTVPKYVLMLCI